MSRHDPGRFVQVFAAVVVTAIALTGCQFNHDPPSNELVTYGGLHETIGLKQHQGRVSLAAVVDRPHFYGVGAVEGLRGEITIFDSVAVVTGGTSDGQLSSLSQTDLQATLLVGRSAPKWSTVVLDDGVMDDRLDRTIADAARDAGIDTTAPFVFLIEGGLIDVRLHVINGACPVHARLKNLALGPDEQAFELEATSLEGTVVGVYAEGSVGRLTHPATVTHPHLIWEDKRTGQRVTGHLERFGLAPGAVLRLPAT